MATIEQENEAREKLNAALDELVKITPETLVRREELGTKLSFANGLPFFERTLKLFQDLHDCQLDNAPFAVLTQLGSEAQQALAEFMQVQTFSPESQPDNTINARDTLINTIRDRYDHYYQLVSPHIAYAIRKGTDFDALERNAREIANEIKRIRSEILDNKDTLKGEAEKILASMRRAAAEVGVSQHNIHFSEEADRHEAASTKWLKATFGFAALALAVAIYSIWYYSTRGVSIGLDLAIQLAVAKILAFSVLSFGFVWSAKIYRAHQHNFVTNKHRQNALSTFEAFVKAAESDEEIKNAVLLRATEAIFSPSASGYDDYGKEGQFTPQIIEVLRTVKPIAKAGSS